MGGARKPEPPPSPQALAIAERLKKSRSDKFETAAEFARTIGVGESTYTMHEAGTRGIKKNVKKYSDALGVSQSYLMFGEDAAIPAHINSVNGSDLSLDTVGNTDNALALSEPTKEATKDLTELENRAGRMPAHGSVPGRTGWIMNPKASKYVGVPRELAGNVGAKALIMAGDEMWPRVKPGDILYLFPLLQALPESLVVIFLKGDPEEWIVRDLVSQSFTSLVVRSYRRKREGEVQTIVIEESTIEWSAIKKDGLVVAKAVEPQ